MRRYRFRLEQVQRVRQVQEDLAAAGLGAAQRAEAEATRAARARREAAAARPRLHGGYGTPEVLAARLVWDAELDAITRADAVRDAASARTADALAEWTTASQRVRALELLDDRRREEHRLEADREEAARVDDLVASRFRRDHAEVVR